MLEKQKNKQISIGRTEANAIVCYLNRILYERGYILGLNYRSRLLQIRDSIAEKLHKKGDTK